jgi:hypothetical protein
VFDLVRDLLEEQTHPSCLGRPALVISHPSIAADIHGKKTRAPLRCKSAGSLVKSLTAAISFGNWRPISSSTRGRSALA